ncbi:hypothetical protein [Algoriphagus sp. Y33]|uniref:hypothetical protein n=1 Tax=Algoriphagus sp. Y33 TaxID=2772483 RepID=UPI001CE05242|nr:hypothetical protein [Algoriphagus sp. Y33]
MKPTIQTLTFSLPENSSPNSELYIPKPSPKYSNESIAVEPKFDFNPDFALGLIAACPDSFREGFKLRENQSLWRSSRSNRYGESEKCNIATDF